MWMMGNDSFDLFRVKHALEQNPNSPLIIISNKLASSKEYKKRLRPYLNEGNFVFEISNGNTNDGLPFIDSIILLCGRWWENKNAFMVMGTGAKLSKLIIPVTYLPETLQTLKGGDNE